MVKQKQQIIKKDILIIGGGLTGATLLYALLKQGYDACLVDTHALHCDARESFDARTLALSPATKNIFYTLGLWEKIAEQITPIESIHVSQLGNFGATRFHAQPDNPLGYVCEMDWLGKSIYQQLPSQCLIAPAQLVSIDKDKNLAVIQRKSDQETIVIQAQCVVGADGGFSSLRRMLGGVASIKKYPQQAIVANIGLKRDHACTAYERFTQNGTIALLPISRCKSALIWCVPEKDAQTYLSMSDDVFLRELQRQFGYRLGRLVRVGARSSFPLHEIIMPQAIDWPYVFIGNAAHTMHPVAGQGFNLGLRDVATLVQCIVQEGLEAKMLERYRAMRQTDQRIIIGLTDGLVKLFANQTYGFSSLRGLGLLAFDVLPGVRELFGYYARGFGGRVADLTSGIPLRRDTERQ